MSTANPASGVFAGRPEPGAARFTKMKRVIRPVWHCDLPAANRRALSDRRVEPDSWPWLRLGSGPSLAQAYFVKVSSPMPQPPFSMSRMLVGVIELEVLVKSKVVLWFRPVTCPLISVVLKVTASPLIV